MAKIHILIFAKYKFFESYGKALKQAVQTMGYDDVKLLFCERGNKGKDIKWSPDVNIVCPPQRDLGDMVYPKNKSTKILIWTEQKPHNIMKYKWDRTLHFFPELKRKKDKYFKLGYSSSFETTYDKRVKGFNKFFFGYFTPYRQKIAKKFNISRTLCSDRERDAIIRNSKLNIIIKNRLKYYFAPLHALHIICNKKLALQQVCEGNYSVYKDYIDEWQVNNLQQKIDYYLNNEDELNELGLQNYEQLKNNLDFNYEFAECMKGIL